MTVQSHCVSFREIPQTTKIFSSFLEDFSKVARYYSYPPTLEGLKQSAASVSLDPESRRVVAEVLRAQNKSFGSSDAAFTNLDRLANGAVAVVTGQQVGLFGGPAYSIYKAITAARFAAELTRQGIDAVPVFWLATEDHDLEEIDHAAWVTSKGLHDYKLEPERHAEGSRVGEIVLGAKIQALVSEAAYTLEGPDSDAVAQALRESYTAQDTFGSAFGKLMARLLGNLGVILFDPLQPQLHRVAAKIYHRALDESGSLRDALIERSKELERGGFHAQVMVSRESTLLFFNVDGRREPLRERNGKFFAGKSSFTAEELHAAIDRDPEAFTSNVLLRPVVQDVLLPTAAYVGGPAEIAYMAQAEIVYKKLVGRMPCMLPRDSFTLIEPAVARLLTKYDLSFEDLFAGRQAVRTKMEQSSLPRALAKKFETNEKALQKLLATYRDPLKKLDKTLLGALDSAEKKMLYQFTKLKGKAGRAENFRTGVIDRHERIILDAIYAHKGLQERTLGALPWLSLYGGELLENLETYAGESGATSACARQHLVVVL
ncbi:MAG: bacillithiol biosynthesis cysteine-adding enzyme BshC [Candidatus Acidiferrales bacterium]